ESPSLLTRGSCDRDRARYQLCYTVFEIGRTNMPHVRDIAKNIQVHAFVELKCVGAQDVRAGCQVLRVQRLHGRGVGAQAVVAPADASLNELGAYWAVEHHDLAVVEPVANDVI